MSETSSENGSIDPVSDYMKIIGEVDFLSAAEERELGIRRKEGDASARLELFEANLPLVVHIAKYHKRAGIELDDLIQVGNVELWHDVDQYDPNLNNRFSTFAFPKIRGAIQQEIASSTVVYVPDYIQEFIRSYQKIFNQMSADNHSVTVESLSDALEMTVHEFKLALWNAHRAKQALAKTHSVNASNAIKNLSEYDPDSHVGTYAERTSPIDTALSEDRDPVEEIRLMEIEKDICEAVEKLAPEAKAIIIASYGLYDNPQESHQEIADRLELKSFRNVYNKERRVLKRLKKMPSLEKHVS